MVLNKKAKPLKKPIDKRAVEELIGRKRAAYNFFVKLIYSLIPSSLLTYPDFPKLFNLHPAIPSVIEPLRKGIVKYASAVISTEQAVGDWIDTTTIPGCVNDSVSFGCTFINPPHDVPSFTSTNFTVELPTDNDAIGKVRFIGTAAYFEISKQFAAVHLGVTTDCFHILPFSVDSADSGELFIPFIQKVAIEAQSTTVTCKWSVFKLKGGTGKFTDQLQNVDVNSTDHVIYVPRKRAYLTSTEMLPVIISVGKTNIKHANLYCLSMFFGIHEDPDKIAVTVNTTYDFINNKQGLSGMLEYATGDATWYKHLKSCWISGNKFQKTFKECQKELAQVPFVSEEEDTKVVVLAALKRFQIEKKQTTPIREIEFTTWEELLNVDLSTSLNPYNRDWNGKKLLTLVTSKLVKVPRPISEDDEDDSPGAVKRIRLGDSDDAGGLDADDVPTNTGTENE